MVKWKCQHHRQVGRKVSRRLWNCELMIHNKTGHLKNYERRGMGTSNVLRHEINTLWSETDRWQMRLTMITNYWSSRSIDRKTKIRARYNTQKTDWNKFRLTRVTAQEDIVDPRLNLHEHVAHMTEVAKTAITAKSEENIKVTLKEFFGIVIYRLCIFLLVSFSLPSKIIMCMPLYTYNINQYFWMWHFSISIILCTT